MASSTHAGGFSPIGQPGTVILYSPGEHQWLEFSRPVEIVSTGRVGEVADVLRLIEESVHRRGLHAAGFVTYESAPAFDPALRVHAGAQVPLCWFGLYEKVRTFETPSGFGSPVAPLGWQPTVTREEYERAVKEIRTRIAGGLTYQVNYSYRLRAAFSNDPWEYFCWLAGGARSGYPAYVDTGRWTFCSASPELFFQLRDDILESRPMKGTAPRGGTAEEDDEKARHLGESEKDQAENLMIVDMIRNDIGRVADVGTVTVPRLFTVERFPTVLQMTSTVTARVRAPFSDIMGALFPCASITGAPKVSTMGIIAEMESTPRGLYCGSIGFLAPDEHGVRAQFNVAIRTVTMDREAGTAEYGVGGAILWDSDPAEEYKECGIKARVLSHGMPDLQLLEAILWTPGEGYYLVERHARRLADSARYFDIPFDVPLFHQKLAAFASRLAPEDHKVRVVLDRDGELTVTAQALSGIAKPAVLRVCLADRPVNSANGHCFHKTSDRRELDRELAEHPGCDDVILWNEKGELTESCSANVVVQIGGARLTPPVACGLLPGTFRAQLLEDGEVREGIVMKQSLIGARAVWLVNSVRRWMPAVVVNETGSL